MRTIKDLQSRLAGRLSYRFIVAVSAVVVVANFALSLHDAGQYGGVDLRARIVGARAIRAGINPYENQADYPKDPKLQDPDGPYPGPSRCTYAPTLLLPYSLLSGLDYKTQRMIWFFLEWLAMLTAIAILAKTIPPVHRKLFIVLSLLFFAGSYFWRLHVERGQYYVFIALLVSIDYWLLTRHPKSRVSGLALGVAAALRPTYALTVPVLWVFGFAKASCRALLVLFLLFTLTIALWGRQSWYSYYQNVKAYEAQILDKDYIQTTYGPIASRPPAQLEGYANLAMMMDARTYNVTFLNIFVGLLSRVGLDAGANHLGTLILWTRNVVMAFWFVFASALIWRIRRHGGWDIKLLFIMMLPICSEFFVPIRYGYADIVYLPVMAAAIPILRGSGLRFSTVLLAAALLLTCQFTESGFSTFTRNMISLTVLPCLLWKVSTAPGAAQTVMRKLPSGTFLPIA